MRIFDIINKLENIKHNYLIYALEKYTNQITSEDIKKKEEERKKQEEVAKEEIKKPVDEVKKPVEEVKKPVEEVKKFETNIMDSLKWVFISIGIFIFIIVGLSLIYWFMFSDNNNEQNIIAVPVNQYVTPPVNQYATPPVNQYATPKNIDNTKDNEESIFSLFSRSDKQPEIISKTKVPTEADIILDVKPIYETHLISKAHTDAEAYLEKRAETDINKLNQDNNISKLILSPAKEDNNINEYKKEVPKV
jgi:flagellar basal body-associated protein FliL